MSRRWLISLIVACSACSSDPPQRAMPAAGGGAGAGGFTVAATAGSSVSIGSTGGTPASLPGAGDDAGAPDRESCATAEYEATFRPLDMLVLLDQSGSMVEDDDRWTPTTNAIKSFVSSKESEGIGIGLQYFPLGGDDDEKCEGATYAQPSVPIAALPGNAKAIVDSIDAHYFTQENCCDAPEHDGTPTRPAMEGVFQYVRSWLASHPERDVVVLLATDGEPSSVCDDNEIEDVAATLEQAVGATPSLKTYVIGIGEEDQLSELATAGGTGTPAFVVDGTGVQTEMQLVETFGKIRGETLRCDFEVPTGMNADPSNVNVQRATGTRAATSLVKVPQPSDCPRATAGGWYYDPASQRIQLCPETCREVLAEPAAKVDIVVGCAAVLL